MSKEQNAEILMREVIRNYKQSCIFAAEDKLMTVANVVLDCFG